MELQSQIAEEFDKTLTLQEAQTDDDEDEDEDEESVSSDFEFSFAGAGDTSSPVSAEEIFQNGQIRPIFPFNVDDKFDEATTSYGPPVRKLFVQSSPESDDIAEGPYCAWSSSEKSAAKAPAPAPEMSRKSNSTGFSKLWRFRDLLVRSHSDGKDAFVFLTTGKGEEKSTDMASEKKVKREKIRVERKECATTTLRGETKNNKKEKGKEKSAYEVFYGKREKKTGKGKSYLPYKQDLVGFFTNVNGPFTLGAEGPSSKMTGLCQEWVVTQQTNLGCVMDTGPADDL
ncbi:hypothetical protein Cgig2_018270 [Carnegiea gigantea]|uniref:Uncharacterized protein n=1 Tax=Carnegiea gigantea TaxID=171969 RepID=A0A9Q1QS54_9CARY|nr:hypothetical protein Cgig2_018270 [Carnegiea gigantea]